MPQHKSPPNTVETVSRFKETSEKFQQEIRKDPDKAKQFLIRAGIAETGPTGVRLSAHFR
jgi:hypothetical protein